MPGRAGSLSESAFQAHDPAAGFSAEDGAEDHYEALDDSNVARQQLSEGISQAVVLRQALPHDVIAALRSFCRGGADGSSCLISSLSLALPSDEGGQGWLVSLPVLAPAVEPEEGAQRQEGLAGGNAAGGSRPQPIQPAGALGPGTSALECFSSGRTLIWRASGGSPAGFSDWAALLSSQPPQDAQHLPKSRICALATLPLRAPDSRAGSPPLGVATFGLQAEPGEADVAALSALCASLAAAIQHHTKAVWEESLGFLTAVIPPRVVQRMLSAAMSMGPLAAAAAPHAAAAAAGDATEPSTPVPGQAPGRLFDPATTGGGKRRGAFAPAVPHFQPAASERGAAGSPQGGMAGLRRSSTAALVPATPRDSLDQAAGQEGQEKGTPSVPAMPKGGSGDPQGPDSCMEQAPAKGGAAGDAGAVPGVADGPPAVRAVRPPLLDVKTLRQKWNLEFADPGLEHSFKTWFNTMQTKTDLAVFRYFSVLLLVLAAALAVRGGTTLGDMVALTHGLLSVAALGLVMLINTPKYIQHRSTVVACVRICSAALLLAHAYVDPGFYSGSLLKGLAGSCALTLVVNSFRNRLRFSNHLLVQLAKLYLCAISNSFIFSDASRAASTYLTLPATTAVQLLCALGPSLAVYRLEAAMRRKFLTAGVEAGLLELPAEGARTPPFAARF